MPVDRAIRLLATGALLAVALAASGCSTQVADMALPSDAPPRPKEAGAYLPVHDLPPSRDDAMNLAEQKRIQQELIAARDRQAATTPPAAATPTPTR